MTEQTEQELYEELIQEEIGKLRKAHPKYSCMDDCELRSLARRSLAVQRQTLIKKLEKDSLEADVSTVGNLFGKTRKEILEMNEKEGC